MTENEISKDVVDACFKIHSTMGAGLFESVYEELIAYEIEKKDSALHVSKAFHLFMRKSDLILDFEQI
jgi:GxxExxY protein